RDQPSVVQLTGGIPAVTRVRIDLGGRQQSQLVIQAQRLRRQAGQPGELTDAHQVHGRLPRAGPTPGSPDCAASPRVKVKSAVCRPAGPAQAGPAIMVTKDGPYRITGGIRSPKPTAARRRAPKAP